MISQRVLFTSIDAKCTKNTSVNCKESNCELIQMYALKLCEFARLFVAVGRLNLVFFNQVTKVK